jgi:hypothetical protein
MDGSMCEKSDIPFLFGEGEDVHFRILERGMVFEIGI